MINGWIAPNGELHQCDYMGHWQLAFELAEKYNHQIKNQDDLIEKYGYIQIFHGLIFDGYNICSLNTITQEQKATLMNIYYQDPSLWHRVGRLELYYLGLIEKEEFEEAK